MLSIRFSSLLLLLIGFLILSSSAQPERSIISEERLTNLDQFKQIATGVQPIEQVQKAPFDELSYLNPKDLTGWYWAEPDGVYYIRQLGNQIYWLGESGHRFGEYPLGWSNVAYGTINGNVVDVNWADVPKGQNMNSGTAEYIISWQNQKSNLTPLLTVQQQTGGFGTVAMHGPWSHGSWA